MIQFLCKNAFGTESDLVLSFNRKKRQQQKNFLGQVIVCFSFEGDR